MADKVPNQDIIFSDQDYRRQRLHTLPLGCIRLTRRVEVVMKAKRCFIAQQSLNIQIRSVTTFGEGFMIKNGQIPA
jgi:hypothetical protein